MHVHGLLGGSARKESAWILLKLETQVSYSGQEDPLEEEMVTHSRILVWRIWREENGGLQSMESQRVRHDWSELSLHVPTEVFSNSHLSERRENMISAFIQENLKNMSIGLIVIFEIWIWNNNSWEEF